MSGLNAVEESSDSGRLEIELEVTKSFINKLVVRIKEAEICPCRHNQCCHGDHKPTWNKRETVPVNEEINELRRYPYELAKSPAARVLQFVEPKNNDKTHKEK
jgi:hypothetical protein